MKIMTHTLINVVMLLTAFIIMQGADSAETSERLQIPDGQTFLLSAKGVGYQIHTSKPKDGSTTEFVWGLPPTPQATLYDNSGKKISKHYAGPTWESTDGSKVIGQLPPKSVPAPKAGDIPWLLIEAKSHEGEGVFSKVSYILRVDTVGGIAPTYAPTRKGQEARVKYRATYIFLAPKQ